MADYTALIAKWATLTPGTTQQKLDQINAMTVTGQVPTTMYCTGADILNCINYTEFKALTAAQQQSLLALCQVQGSLLGGSANTAHMTAGMIVDYFLVGGPVTIAALTALAKGTVTPLWQAPVAQGGLGLTGTVGPADLALAGGLT